MSERPATVRAALAAMKDALAGLHAAHHARDAKGGPSASFIATSPRGPSS